jgi:CheY-like chemotaxis protein
VLDAAQTAGEAIARIERLQRLTAALASASTAAECAAVLSTAGRAALQAQAAIVWLVDLRGETLELVASDGYAGPDLEPFRSIPLDGALPICDALRGASRSSWNPRTTGSGAIPRWRRRARPASSRGRPSPSCCQGRPIGALSLSFDRQRASRRGAGPHRHHGGAVVQAIERTRLFDAEVQARKEVEQANRTKDEFLAMLGHELRNPLSPDLTALQLMRLRGGDCLLKERTIIERQVKHMARLVDDLLDVSRVARGKVVALARARRAGRGDGQGPRDRQPGPRGALPPALGRVPQRGLMVDADDERLAQVFANLLTNAAKFTEPGGRIQVAAEPREGRVRVSVRDSGVGIDAPAAPAHLRSLHAGSPRRDGAARRPGHRPVDRAQPGAPPRRHRQRPQRRPGRAASSWSSSPATTAGAHPPAPPPGPAPAATARRVLIVDDNRDAADSLSEGLTACGHLTAVAYDGPAALQTATAFQPEVVFLDIGLPVMDGYELARRLRAQVPPEVALVALTGYWPGIRPRPGPRRRVPSPPGQADRSRHRRGPGGPAVGALIGYGQTCTDTSTWPPCQIATATALSDRATPDAVVSKPPSDLLMLNELAPGSRRRTCRPREVGVEDGDRVAAIDDEGAGAAGRRGEAVDEAGLVGR